MNGPQKNTSSAFFIPYIMVLVTPLISVPTGAERFELPKLAAMALFTILMLLVTTITLATGERRLSLSLPMGLAVLAFLMLTVLSFWQSMDPLSALYGHFGRRDGLLTYGLLGALFLAATQYDWRTRPLNNLLWAVTAGALGVSILALPEYFGLNLLGAPSATGRIASTLGNPVFLSGYLIFGFFSSIILTIIHRSKLTYAFPIIIFLVIVLTSARSAIFGIILGTLAILVHERSTMIRHVRLLGALLAVTTVIAISLQLYAAQTGQPSLSEALRPTRISQAAALRLESIRASLEIIKERPLLGAGPSNYPWARQAVQSDSAAELRGQAWRSDDAHNFFLQTGASLGLPALIAMIAVIGLALRKCWQLALEEKLYLALFGGLIGFLGAVLFEPTNISALMLFWVFVGIIASRPGHDRTTAIPRAVGITALAILAFGGLLVTLVLLKAVGADISYARGQRLAQQGQLNEAAQKHRRAIELAPHVDRYYLNFGNLLMRNARLTGNNELAAEGVRLLEKATEYGRLDPQNWIRLSLAYQYGAAIGQDQLAIKALAAANMSLELSPSTAAAHRALGEILLKQGRRQEALEQLLVATSIDNNYGEGWLWLGVAHEASGSTQEAINAYTQAAKSPTTQFDAENKLRTLTNK